MIKPHYGNQSLLKLKRVISLFFSKFSSFLRGCLPCHTKPTDTCVAMSDSEENNNQNTTDIPFPSNPTMTDTPSHKQLITINVANQLPFKLTSTNYYSWKTQFDALLYGYDLLRFIDRTNRCPSQTTGNPPRINFEYTFWKKQDKPLLPE